MEKIKRSPENTLKFVIFGQFFCEFARYMPKWPKFTAKSWEKNKRSLENTLKFATFWTIGLNFTQNHICLKIASNPKTFMPCFHSVFSSLWQKEYSAWKEESAGIGIFKIGQTVPKL